MSNEDLLSKLPENIRLGIEMSESPQAWWEQFNNKKNLRKGDMDAGTRELIRLMFEDKLGHLPYRKDQGEDGK